MKTRICLLSLAVALFALAGCGGDEGGGEQPGGEGGLAERGDINIEFVTHATPDPFWSVVQNGVSQAEEDMGVNVNYRELDSYDIPQLQRNLEAAVAAEPDGMAVSIPDADALGPTIREATEDGIPVVVLNAGEDDWEELGAVTYVGQTERAAGVAAGERMAGEGVGSAICINHEQGNFTLDQRCEGFTEGLGGDVEQVAVDGSDPTAARNGIATALQQNPDVEGLLTLNPGVADQALRALNESGRSEDMTFATFDLSPSVLEAVRDGEMLFATDQQQFLQGYLPVVFLTSYVQYGTRPVSEVQTGPAFITEENAEEVIDLSEQGIR
ncbi:MAG: sugar ABC transporter substrate-binding protein [Rubrobacteraceae bacterium]